jgi:nitrite reductase/ring-hydroxylating ferredoxin subunit
MVGTKITLNGKELAIFKFKSVIYALNDACPHQGASLHLGDIEDIDGTLCISCPRHHWPFSLEDGSCLIGVNIQAQLHPTEIRQNSYTGKSTVFIGFTSFCDSLFKQEDF